MKGILFAICAGAFITLQGVTNSRISQDIGTWQTATITHFTGFLLALFILFSMKDKSWRGLKEVKPLYLFSGTFGAIVIFSIITAIHYMGVTLTISAMLISQLGLTFLIDWKGWFGMKKQDMKMPQFLGMAMMILGVIVLGM